MKLIFASGISGVGEKNYLTRWVEYCQSRGKKVKVFQIGDLMFKHAYEIGLDLNPDNILNADPDLLLAIRSAVLMQISYEIKLHQELPDAVIICLHAFFFWKKRFQRAYDRFLNKFSPDMFFTFIDDFRNIVRRLGEKSQWRNENLTHAEILSWQNIEVEVTCGLAEFAEKPFLALASGQPISTLYKLIFHPEIEPIYIQMPISHFREPSQRMIIDRFIERLDKYFAVISPLAVEVVGAMSREEFRDQDVLTVNNHIVHRDLYWFVRRTKKSIVFWPGVVPSPGVNHETHEAFVKTKDVWVVYLGSEASPFITYFNTGLFQTEEEFFAFLDEKYPGRKDLVW